MMRILMVSALATTCCFAVVAQTPAKSSDKPAAKKANTAAKTAKKPAPKAATPTIPPGAVEIEPGTYRWVDSKGVAWIYVKTPFGLMKSQETKKQELSEAVPTDWKVVDEGDSLTFERPYPFGGTKKWTKKKNDLSETETAVWQRAQGAQATKQ